MDDLVPIAIFAIVMLFSVIGNITRRLRKTDEPEPAPRKSPAEVLRRMITEAEEIPVARPQAGPPPLPQYRTESPPLARPLDQPRMQGPEPIDMTREVVIQPAAPSAPTLRDRAEEIRRQLEKAFQAAVEQAAPPPVSSRELPRRQRQPEKRSAVPPPVTQARQRRAPEPPRKPAPGRPSRVGQLFPGMDAVRRAIVLAEVLGPPKGLQ